MYRCLHLFATLVSVCCTPQAVHAQWASLSGRFVFGDEHVTVPKQVLIKPGRDINFCGQDPLVDESLIINAANRGIANIVIWAYKPNPKAIHPGYEKSAKDVLRMDTDGRFQLKDLPAERLTLKVWHEKVGYIQTVRIDGQEATWKKGRYVIDLMDRKSQEHQFVISPALFAEKLARRS